MTTDRVICKVCRRQLSRYYCPKCNIPYCSLTCFRSEAHSQCSETFYRKEIEADIRAEPSKSAQERQKMMELLKRFEEQAAADDDLDESSEDEDDDDSLARRLKRIDLDHISPDALWEILTLAERDKFLKALDNPSSELAQRLLADEMLERDRKGPWWDAPCLPEDEVSPTHKRFGVKPKIMSIPAKMIQSRPDTPFLLYNISAVFLAYAYATRSLGTSPLGSLAAEDGENGEARRIIAQLVPVLTDRKAKSLYPSLSAIITDVWSRLDPGKVTPQVFTLLLRDAAHLLRPSTISIVPYPIQTETTQEEPAVYLSREFLDSHPSSNALCALSDLSVLFKSKQEERTSQNHITLKLVFYAAYILSTSLLVLKTIADEMLIRSKTMERESIETTASVVRQPPPTRDHNTTGPSPFIEEI